MDKLAQQYFNNSWNNPDCFDVYEARRQFVTPLLEMHVRTTFADYLEEGARILEFGAGAGALSRYAGPDWPIIETEQNPSFLTHPREVETQKAAMVLPNLAVSGDSLDAVVGLGVLDTLSTETVKDLGPEFARVLKAGGHLIHFMDMGPDLLAEVHNAREVGMIPFLSSDQETGSLALHHVPLRKYDERVKRLPIDQPVKNVLIEYRKNPSESIARMNRTSILGLLAATLEEHGLVEQTYPDFFEHISRRVVESASESGLELVRSSFDAIYAELNLPDELMSSSGKPISSLKRTAGALSVIYGEPDTSGSEPMVSALSDMHILVMRKVEAA